MKNEFKQTRQVKDRKPNIRKYSRLLLIVGIIIAAFLTTSYCLLRQKATNDVMTKLEKIGYGEHGEIKIKYRNMRISRTHGVWFAFDLVNDNNDRSWAKWTLIPWGEVMLFYK